MLHLKLNIRTKLLGGFLVIVALLVFISGLSIMKMAGMNSNSLQMQSYNFPALVNVAEIRTELYKLRGDLFKLLLETDDAMLEEIQGAIREDQAKLADRIKAYGELSLTADQRATLETIKESVDRYNQFVPKVNELRVKDQNVQAYGVLIDALPDLQKAQDTADLAVSNVIQGADDRIDSTVASYSSGRLMILIISSIAAIAAIVLGVVISQGIVGPVSKLLAAMVRMAGGDLREEVAIKNRDEFGRLAAAANEMITSLRKLIGGTVEAAQSVAASSEEISATTEEIASGSQSQAQAAQKYQSAGSGSDPGHR
ncbi:methyl-accepting chemotaxis protein [Paenibacillus rhizoplanae]